MAEAEAEVRQALMEQARRAVMIAAITPAAAAEALTEETRQQGQTQITVTPALIPAAAMAGRENLEAEAEVEDSVTGMMS
jgi:hypothetical protein